jgi:elongation factor Ts
MAAITAAMVGELRAKTDAPMMECKKALTEADGDMVKAEEILRVKLGNKASKAASRVTAEGVVAAHIAGGIGALVEVNCETDFVSKNDDFLNFTKHMAQLVADKNPADVAALSALPMDGKTVEEVRSALIGKIGENMSIRRFQRFETSAKLVSYLHGTRIGVMVEYDGADEQVGKDVAMHIAAMKPVALSSAQVPAELEVGSLLATPVTGAYGYSMASNYNMVTKPAVVFVKDGHARVVRRRETYEDLLTLNPS